MLISVIGSVRRYVMTTLGEDKPRCVELLCRDINITSQMWHCTPESVPRNRSTATRRLDYSTVPAAPPLLFHIPAAISTQPTLNSGSAASDDLHCMTLALPEVVRDLPDEMVEFQFNDEQIDCICDVLRQSEHIERLSCFLSRLTRDQLTRDSGHLYKVDCLHH